MYLDYTIPHPSTPIFIKRVEQIHEITFSKTVDVNKTRIFNIMKDLQDYPLVFPRYILSSNIINHTNDVEYAEERTMINGIIQKFIVKHTVIPYNKQTLEILSGDARGTIITETFGGNDTLPILTTNVKLHLQGLLEPFAYVEVGIAQNQLSQAIDQFVIYAKQFDNNPTYKIVDQLYREILKRPADAQGLQYYGSMLESGKMTTNDIRKALLASDEYKKRF